VSKTLHSVHTLAYFHKKLSFQNKKHAKEYFLFTRADLNVFYFIIVTSMISDKPAPIPDIKTVYQSKWSKWAVLSCSMDQTFSQRSLHNLLWQILAKHCLNPSLRNWYDTTEQLEGKVSTKSSS